MNKSKFMPLCKVASVSISNVDKKTSANESEVLLCNYVDVYRNWAITEGISSKLMKATANNHEIEKFSLHKGDVCITKDSETKDDIGMSTFIADDIQGLVLGYHCALISPQKDVLDGKYLNAFLQTEFVRHYYELNASGSGQRYTLTLDIIGSIPVPVIPLAEQRKIGHIFSAIDRKIESNNKINDNLQHQLKLLYDYWFTQFDFPDENGKPYRASGGAMVWCDELQREIPKGWKVSSLSDIAVLQAKSVMPQEGTAYNHYSIPAFDDTHSPAVEDGKAIASNKYVVPDNSVLVSKLNPQFKRIWLIIDSTDNAICSTEFLPVKATETGVYALYSLLNSDAFSVHLIQNASSSTGSRKRIDPDNCMSYKFPYDQKVFARFDKAIQPLIMKITGIPTETQALVALRDWLLPMLMNGQATISD